MVKNNFKPQRGHEDDPVPVSVTIKFQVEAKGVEMDKPKGGFLLGTSPEFEIGLYTAGLILSGNKKIDHFMISPTKTELNVMNFREYSY